MTIIYFLWCIIIANMAIVLFCFAGMAGGFHMPAWYVFAGIWGGVFLLSTKLLLLP